MSIDSQQNSVQRIFTEQVKRLHSKVGSQNREITRLKDENTELRKLLNFVLQTKLI